MSIAANIRKINSWAWFGAVLLILLEGTLLLAGERYWSYIPPSTFLMTVVITYIAYQNTHQPLQGFFHWVLQLLMVAVVMIIVTIMGSAFILMGPPDLLVLLAILLMALAVGMIAGRGIASATKPCARPEHNGMSC